MTVLASGVKGQFDGDRERANAGAGRRRAPPAANCCDGCHLAGEDPAALDAILITHEHLDHVAGLAVLARRLGIPVYFTETTHRAWVRMLTPRTTMNYAKWLDHMQAEKQARAEALAAKVPTYAGACAASNAGERPAAEALEAVAAISAEAGAFDTQLQGEGRAASLGRPARHTRASGRRGVRAGCAWKAEGRADVFTGSRVLPGGAAVLDWRPRSLSVHDST